MKEKNSQEILQVNEGVKVLGLEWEQYCKEFNNSNKQTPEKQLEIYNNAINNVIEKIEHYETFQTQFNNTLEKPDCSNAAATLTELITKARKTVLFLTEKI
jgi:hypothetical protein